MVGVIFSGNGGRVLKRLLLKTGLEAVVCGHLPPAACRHLRSADVSHDARGGDGGGDETETLTAGIGDNEVITRRN